MFMLSNFNNCIHDSFHSLFQKTEHKYFYFVSYNWTQSWVGPGLHPPPPWGEGCPRDPQAPEGPWDAGCSQGWIHLACDGASFLASLEGSASCPPSFAWTVCRLSAVFCFTEKYCQKYQHPSVVQSGHPSIHPSMCLSIFICLSTHHLCTCVLSVWSLGRVWLFATTWTAAHQASLPITNSRSFLKLISIEWVMPSNHLILCRPLLHLSSLLSYIHGCMYPSIHLSAHPLARPCIRRTFKAISRT